MFPFENSKLLAYSVTCDLFPLTYFSVPYVESKQLALFIFVLQYLVHLLLFIFTTSTLVPTDMSSPLDSCNGLLIGHLVSILAPLHCSPQGTLHTAVREIFF